MVEITVKPMCSWVYTSTPVAPPATQASCSSDSDRPNADARDSSGRSSCSDASSEAFAIALAAEVTNAASAATNSFPVSAVASATTVTAVGAAHDQLRRMAQLQPGAGVVAAEVADGRRRADQAENQQLLPAALVVRLGNERGIEEQETDHHLDGAVAPQRGDDVAAQRLSCATGLARTAAGGGAVRRCGRGSSAWWAPRPR